MTVPNTQTTITRNHNLDGSVTVKTKTVVKNPDGSETVTETTEIENPKINDIEKTTTAPVPVAASVNASKTTSDVSVPMGQSMAVAPKQVHGTATASLACGIISFFILGIILGPLAIIFGINAKKEIAENPETFVGQGQATAGIICGSIGFVLSLVLIIIIATS